MTNPSRSLAQLRAVVDQALAAGMHRLGEPSPLRDACGYALLNGGKRLRPAIVLLVAEAKGHPQEVVRAALATEYFHTASLIADDLPCMDDALDRRGRAALHRAYGEDVAVLASYALIAEGYRSIAATSLDLERAAPGRWGRACALAVECASVNTGLGGAAGGQYLDLHPPAALEAALPELLHMKTATLFEISFVFGWLFGGGDAERLPRVRALSKAFGLAYQLADDLDDFEQDAAKGAVNYAVHLGADRAQALLRASLATCEEIADELGLRTAAFLELLGSCRTALRAA